ncbi:hypothetical protein MAIT1_01995 [Magnetofaba australis IT-1]|uniref:F5/8 type C domain-containing protein n=1 Tax=Magnetofaba australis IT-1 TaxID=1434232 RepID=A0A1Y2K1U8_9PROT|nr:hypothetical protein MAIT1_01995 [Magnetofaba australis IT-1]
MSIGLAWSWPLLDPRYLPLHDSLFLVESFHYFYSHLAQHGELPYWIPALDYGVPATIQFFSAMEPSRVAVMALGLLLRIDDALLLVKIAFLLDQAILTLGVWLLARELFRQPGAVFLTTLAAAFVGQPWLLLVQFNLGIVYLLPMQLFLVVRGCRLHSSGHLFAALALAPFAYYFVGLHLLILFIALLFARRAHRWPWREMLRLNRARAAGLALLCVWAAICLGFYWHISQSTDFLHGQEGRVGPFVPLSEYLTYSDPMIRLPRLLHLLGGAMDFTRVRVSGYTGWLPLLAFVYALLVVRSRLFLGFALATLAAWGISAGGVIAALAYLFPSMQLLRHLGHIGGIVQVLLIISAGFGLERLFRAAGRAGRRGAAWSLWKRRPTRTELLLLAGLALLIVDGVGAYIVHTDVLPTRELAGGTRWEWLIAYLTRIVAYVAAGVWMWRWGRRAVPRGVGVLALALGAALMLDVGLFHGLERHNHPRLDAEARARITPLFSRSPLAYQAQRIAHNQAMADAQKYFGAAILDGGPLRASEDVRDPIHHATLGWETCQHAWPALVISPQVRVLLTALGVGAQEFPDYTRSLAQASAKTRAMLGCERPKLRLLHAAQGARAHTPVEAVSSVIARPAPTHVTLRSAADFRAAPLRITDPQLQALLPSPPADARTRRLQTYRDDAFFERRITLPFALDLRFQSPFQVRSYAMRSGPHGADSRDRMPLAWRLWGSNDGQTWSLLSQVRNAPPWRQRETREFAIDAPARYTRYRLQIDALAAGEILRLHQFVLSPLQLRADSAAAPDAAATPRAGELEQPLRYHANLLKTAVRVSDPQGAWLVYADAINPYWKARLDGRRAELWEADLGFKALFIPPGEHLATFYYDDPIARWLFRAFLLFPIAFALALARLWRGPRALAARLDR